MNILYLSGTRAEYSPMRRTLLALDKKYNLFLIVTGTHLEEEFGYTVKEIIHDNLKIALRVKLPHLQYTKADMAANAKFLETKITEFLAGKHFDLCIVMGDRYEAVVIARAAKGHGIPVLHQGGGDKSGGMDDHFRRQITKYANIHLPGNIESTKRLRRMGIPQREIHMFGEPGLDDIVHHDFTSAAAIYKKFHLNKHQPIVLCVMHPDTGSRISGGKQIRPLLDAFKAIALQTVIVYPNNDVGGLPMILEIKMMRSEPYMRIARTLNRVDFLGLLNVCDIFVGNSSAGLTETTLLNIPFINVGNRQKGRLADKNVIPVKCDTSRIVAEVQKNLEKKGTFTLGYVYGKGNFTKQCMKLLRTYERNR